MQTTPSSDITQRSRYFLYIAILFVAVLMISNTTATKIVKLGPFFISGATVIFPISYIFGDILTEVYGYQASRKIIWSGFGALLLMAFSYWFIQILPAAPYWTNQGAYEAILGSIPRIVIASMSAYFCGEFANSFVMSKMKILTRGRHLWTRTVGSTVVGEGVDSLIFGVVAFGGVFAVNNLITFILSIYFLKVIYEIAATPLTYAIVRWLKRAEQMDVYDHGINYNPFSLEG